MKEVIELISPFAGGNIRKAGNQGKTQYRLLEDYKVSLAERLIPAAEVSEQISLPARKRAGPAT